MRRLKKEYKASVYTLGCRVNLYESEAIADGLKEVGFTVTDFSERCDVYIINTCTVTAESDRKSRQMIRRALKNNPDAAVLVCGCHSQIFPDETADISGVSYVGGTLDKMALVERAVALVEDGIPDVPEICVGDPMNAAFEKMEATVQDRTRAFLKIEDGCENNCSYCIIPKARGKIRSKPMEDVLDEVQRIVSNGYREIVLTGIETAAYGRDLGYGLIELLERLEAMDGLSRIRLGSLEPSYLKPHIIDRLSKLKKPMPYYHLSLQSGTDRTLNAMKRRYNTKMVRATVNMMREKIPNVTFGSDFIVGFPGETDIDHRSTIDFVDSLEILNSHIFSYSVRPGTLAAEMKEQNSKETKEKRHKELQAVADRMQKRCIDSFIEKRSVFNVLFETHRDGYLYGYTENYIYVKVKGDPCLCGSEGRAVLTKYNEKDGMTEGELI